MEPEADRTQAMLDELRAMRDLHPQGDIRSAYNDVCDRLDVLLSKLVQIGDQP